MTVVNIRGMRVSMFHVVVGMRVGMLIRDNSLVIVKVVPVIMPVTVFMNECLVPVPVHMLLAGKQEKTCGHEGECDKKRRPW
jgi:hypothetical protein